MCKQIQRLLFISFLLSPPLFADELQAGLATYQRHDYFTAKRLLTKPAQQGQAVAQVYLGELYDKGNGVPQDYKMALYWYQKAAAQNNAHAQFKLGLLYANGHGVKMDNRQAYAWFAMAFENGFTKAAQPLMVMNKSMSSTERQLALQIAARKNSQTGNKGNLHSARQ
jgi:TPR repeat protein